MEKTANIFARVEPELKEQAENVLEQHRLPFRIKQPELMRPVAMGNLTRVELDAELQRGYDDYLAEHSRPVGETFQQIEQELGL